MKYARTICLIVLILIGALVSSAIAEEGPTVNYELTPEKLLAARILITSSAKFPDYPKYSVIAELNFEEMRVFRELTKENVGRRLEVSFQGRVLMGAIVKAEIESGTMNVLRTNDKEEALALVRELLP
ncbi:hypothetical protein EPN96_04595 [bacterium]|nr:MAG: hypothetical protein EPN96_04595 [bacterium]